MSHEDDVFDAEADELIAKCVTDTPRKSFFLFAGAGSGKTRSLVEALITIKSNLGANFRLDGRRVGVITFTNNACNEIRNRLKYDELFDVKTIHSFAWSLIKGLNHDIRKWLKTNLKEEISKLEELERKGRPGTKASIDRIHSIASKNERLDTLYTLKKFRYNPDGDNPENDALNHVEVIKITTSFLADKPMMQKLLINRFPILLIDESQDTSKELIESLLGVQSGHKERFVLGVIGDFMQRIYLSGTLDLAKNLPEDWATPIKRMNHRSCSRIIKLINRIREPVDGQEQRPRSDKGEGFVRFFILPAEMDDKPAKERECCKKMTAITGDDGWLEPGENVKTLILEHRMAAYRLGFLVMWDSLRSVGRLQTGLKDGSLPGLRLFSGLILPLITANNAKDNFAVASIVRKNSPLMDKKTLMSCKEGQKCQLEKAKTAVDDLVKLWEDGKSPTFMDVLKSVNKTGLFKIPEVLIPFTKDNEGEPEDTEPEDEGDELKAWRKFLESKFEQIEKYSQYVQGEAQYDTHQGIKGLEFPRVCVIMDDSDAGGFLFSYEKLFGAKPDSKKTDPTQETSVDRTKRLFYVTCSRAEDSLALIAYTEAPEAVKKHLLDEGWFKEDEVEIIVERRGVIP